jgi:uncharacterized protein (DUF1778 family)
MLKLSIAKRKPKSTKRVVKKASARVSVRAASEVVAVKRERLEARLDTVQKALIERAAQLQGRSVSDFVLAATLDAATRVVQEATVLTLSAAASHRLAAALLNPAPPNASMQRAATKHRTVVRV